MRQDGTNGCRRCLGRCMRTTLASASDASLRRRAVRSISSDSGASSHSPMNGTEAASATCSMTRRSAARAYTASTTTLWPARRTSAACSANVGTRARTPATSILPDRGAARQEHRTDASASRRCATRPHPGRRRPTAQDRVRVSTSPSPRNLQPPRGMDAADAEVVRPWRDTRAPCPRAHCGVARHAEVAPPSRSSWRERPPCRTETAARERRRRSLPSRPGNGSRRCWHGAAVCRRQRSIRRNARS